jgi:hypothetical protein
MQQRDSELRIKENDSKQQKHAIEKKKQSQNSLTADATSMGRGKIVPMKEIEMRDSGPVSESIDVSTINDDRSNKPAPSTGERENGIDQAMYRLSNHRGRPKDFFDRVDELKAYKEKHGHLHVHHKEDQSLYHFCGQTRFARRALISRKGTARKLTEYQIAALDAIGFDWNLGAGASCTMAHGL